LFLGSFFFFRAKKGSRKENTPLQLGSFARAI